MAHWTRNRKMLESWEIAWIDDTSTTSVESQDLALQTDKACACYLVRFPSSPNLYQLDLHHKTKLVLH